MHAGLWNVAHQGSVGAVQCSAAVKRENERERERERGKQPPPLSSQRLLLRSEMFAFRAGFAQRGRVRIRGESIPDMKCDNSSFLPLGSGAESALDFYSFPQGLLLLGY